MTEKDSTPPTSTQHEEEPTAQEDNSSKATRVNMDTLLKLWRSIETKGEEEAKQRQTFRTYGNKRLEKRTGPYTLPRASLPTQNPRHTEEPKATRTKNEEESKKETDTEVKPQKDVEETKEEEKSTKIEVAAEEKESESSSEAKDDVKVVSDAMKGKEEKEEEEEEKEESKATNSNNSNACATQEDSNNGGNKTVPRLSSLGKEISHVEVAEEEEEDIEEEEKKEDDDDEEKEVEVSSDKKDVMNKEEEKEDETVEEQKGEETAITEVKKEDEPSEEKEEDTPDKTDKEQKSEVIEEDDEEKEVEISSDKKDIMNKEKEEEKPIEKDKEEETEESAPPKSETGEAEDMPAGVPVDEPNEKRQAHRHSHSHSHSHSAKSEPADEGKSATVPAGTVSATVEGEEKIGSTEVDTDSSATTTPCKKKKDKKKRKNEELSLEGLSEEASNASEEKAADATEEEAAVTPRKRKKSKKKQEDSEGAGEEKAGSEEHHSNHEAEEEDGGRKKKKDKKKKQHDEENTATATEDIEEPKTPDECTTLVEQHDEDTTLSPKKKKKEKRRRRPSCCENDEETSPSQGHQQQQQPSSPSLSLLPLVAAAEDIEMPKMIDEDDIERDVEKRQQSESADAEDTTLTPSKKKKDKKKRRTNCSENDDDNNAEASIPPSEESGNLDVSSRKRKSKFRTIDVISPKQTTTSSEQQQQQQQSGTMTTTEAAAGEELNVEEKPRRRSHKNKTIAAVQQELAGGESASAPSTPTFERKRKGSCFCGTTAAESQLLANNGNVRKRSSSTRRAYKGSDVSEGTAGDSSGSGTGTGTPATGQTMPRKGASVSATPIKGGESCGKTLLCTGPLNDDWKKHKAWASLSGSGQHSEGPEGDKISARQRHEVEIVETEAEYVEKLTLIKELYETPLATLAKGNEKAMIITQAQVTHIFSNLDIILTYNGVLYKQMREWKDWKDNGGSSATPSSSSSSSTPAGATNSGSKCKCSGQAPRSLGAIFLTLTDFLKTYTGYCNNYPRALETLAELREKNKRFVEFLEKTQTHPKLGGMDINMLILMPIQRIPRYVLLLQELLKCTPEDDPDHSKLVLALEKMRAVADDLNKKKKDAEDREVLKSVAKRLVLTDSEPLLAVPSRRFVKEGEVVVLASFIEKGKAKNFYAFLFNDIFCFAKATIGGKFKAAEVFRIIDYTVDTTDLTTAPKGTLKKPLTPASAAIAFSSDTKSFLLTTEDPNVLADWLDKIKDCKLQLQKSVQTFKDAELKLSKRST